jgi:hypothetical protein
MLVIGHVSSMTTCCGHILNVMMNVLRECGTPSVTLRVCGAQINRAA